MKKGDKVIWKGSETKLSRADNLEVGSVYIIEDIIGQSSARFVGKKFFHRDYNFTLLDKEEKLEENDEYLFPKL